MIATFFDRKESGSKKLAPKSQPAYTIPNAHALNFARTTEGGNFNEPVMQAKFERTLGRPSHKPAISGLSLYCLEKR